MKTILVIEDEPLLRKALAEKFTNNSYTVLEAADGEEGLSTALQKHPDLILLDIEMPKMDGLTMMKKLREDPWGKDAPIIILTNSLADDLKIKVVVEDHPAYYLTKSDSSLEDILAKVNEVVEN